MDIRPHCEVCLLVFPDAQSLNSHRIICTPSAPPGTTFSGAWTNYSHSNGKGGGARIVRTPDENKENVSGKILPLSQPLHATSATQGNKGRACSHCNRNFKNSRGLGAHLRSCPVKNLEERTNAEAQEIMTSQAEIDDLIDSHDILSDTK